MNDEAMKLNRRNGVPSGRPIRKEAMTGLPALETKLKGFWLRDQRRRNMASIRSVTRKPPTTL